jgi:hypothetical protein
MTLSELRATLLGLEAGQSTAISPDQYVDLFPGGQKGGGARAASCNEFAGGLGCRVERMSERHSISFIKVKGTGEVYRT